MTWKSLANQLSTVSNQQKANFYFGQSSTAGVTGQTLKFSMDLGGERLISATFGF